MPLMHFAFGSLHRNGLHMEQAKRFFEEILQPRSLKSFICPEFLPLRNSPNALWGDPNSASIDANGNLTFQRWVKSPDIALLPCDVPMISFVDIPFRKLNGWQPATHYGNLGLAFTNSFKRRCGVKKVNYYTQSNLLRDPLVAKYQELINTGSEADKERVANELLHYRKPSILWKEFVELFSVIKHMGNSFEKITYSRYEIGYDFRIEQESRIVTAQQLELVNYLESEVLAILVPSQEVKEYLLERLNEAWFVVPELKVCSTRI